MPRLRLFAVGICQLAYEVSDIAAFLPSFREIGSDGPRCPSDLVSEGISLLRWKPFRRFEYLLLNFKCQLIDPQVFEARNLLAHFAVAEHVVPLAALGIELDERLNDSPAKGARRISADKSPTTVLVVPTDEELAIAQACVRLLDT
jgi:hypothetical protein